MQEHDWTPGHQPAPQSMRDGPTARRRTAAARAAKRTTIESFQSHSTVALALCTASQYLPWPAQGAGFQRPASIAGVVEPLVLAILETYITRPFSPESAHFFFPQAGPHIHFSPIPLQHSSTFFHFFRFSTHPYHFTHRQQIRSALAATPTSQASLAHFFQHILCIQSSPSQAHHIPPKSR